MTPAEELRDAVLAFREGGEIPTRELIEPLCAWLEKRAKRFEDEIIRDRPDCPNCGEGCGGHAEEEIHDGGCGGIIADNVDDSDRCTCFTDALAVARAITGGAS